MLSYMVNYQARLDRAFGKRNRRMMKLCYSGILKV
jgi:hypothetical protein